jgi:hypothetical protein
MIMVEATVLDQNGNWLVMPARMEDKSVSGACVRFKKPIAVGAQVKIQSRFEQFSGMAKYCRSDGWDYLVGIQKDKDSAADGPVRTATPPPAGTKNLEPLIATANMQSRPPMPESAPGEIAAVAGVRSEMKSEVQIRPILREHRAIAIPRAVGHEAGNRDRPRVFRHRELDVVRRTRTANRNEAGKEKKTMKPKWLERSPWQHKQDDLNVSGAERELNGGENRNGKAVRESPTRASSFTHTESPFLHPSEEDASFHAELLSIDDICSAAGVPNAPKGYSINKVVEMLRSEHIRGLSKELKRAAVLMALDVAGVSVAQIQQDAKARQDALDSYEAGQQNQVEAEWARKVEENNQIQAEMERVKAQYMARITRNLDGVAREKGRFSTWQTMKKQISQTMAEALDLCAKSAGTESPSPLIANASGEEQASAAAAGAKPS